MSNKGFSFESNLEHQQKAVDSVVDVFDYAKGNTDSRINPELDFSNFANNVKSVQQRNGISMRNKDEEHIIDVQMETGTGKTYTYTKTMFEMNKKLGVNKFIVVVPTLSIKAGTLNFLTSDSTIQHFRDQYGKVIEVSVLESNKNSKKKERIPNAIRNFSEGNSKDKIYVLLVNSGMINSNVIVNEEKVWSFEYQYETNLLDNYSTILQALQSIKPVMIIDEPHKFKDKNVTWKRLININPQLIIRYGATFEKNFYNQVYCLNAIDAFNKNLVKGIKVVIDEFDAGTKVSVKINKIDKTLKKVTFERNDGKKKSTKTLTIDDSLSKVDDNCVNLKIDKIGSGKITLSNGQDFKTGDKINPYLFNQEFTNRMIQKSVEKHFEIEKQLMNQDIRIKPLTLFFIDDIASYRLDNGPGELAKYVEKVVEKEIKKRLKDKDLDERYREYLEKSLEDLSLTHGGYFSKDNTGKDEEIQAEVNEILHDKISLLDVDNPRRFIFSKWTLKEGWDNPNVFQITKLRTSGSETSKLQEVGRGLRIPVNEFMQRVDQEIEQHYLYYRVDFSEKDFAKSLVDEINSSSDFDLYLEPGKVITEKQLDVLCEKLDKSPYEIVTDLIKEEIIDADKVITDKAQDKLENILSSDFVKKEKIKIDDGKKAKTCKVRENNYKKLQHLWEDINKQLILEYDVDDKELTEFFKESVKNPDNYSSNTRETEQTLKKGCSGIVFNDITKDVDYINTLNYGEFLTVLSDTTHLKVSTLNDVFVELKKKDELDISNYLTYETVKKITNSYFITLRNGLISNTNIKYQTVNAITKKTPFTDSDGNLIEVLASNLGTEYEEGSTPPSYLFDEIYYDSSLERDNIKQEIESVEVYTKIPKRSVKIPVPGGKTYSPDFAYVVKDKKGKSNLNLVVETKGKDEENLHSLEANEIELANIAFGDNTNISFKKQLSNKKIIDILNEIRGE